jgi:hypothetical protein
MVFDTQPQKRTDLMFLENKNEVAHSLKLLLCLHTLCKSEEALVDGGITACFEVLVKNLQYSKYGKYLAGNAKTLRFHVEGMYVCVRVIF